MNLAKTMRSTPRTRRFIRRAARRARALLLIALICTIVRVVPTPCEFELLPADRERPEAPFLERMVDPFLGLAASAQWVRADAAMRRGELALGYARAETALRLDPRSSGGWIFLARHFVLDRAAAERESDSQAREVWIHAGLDVLERGEKLCSDPGVLAFERGLVYSYFAASGDPKKVGVSTPRAAWELAAAAFERAVRLGNRAAIEARDVCRERALELER